MATKTITVDLEAYNRLKKAKLANESFSQTIKRVVPPPFDLEKWLKTVRENAFSKDMIAAVEQRIAGRRKRSRRRI